MTPKDATPATDEAMRLAFENYVRVEQGNLIRHAENVERYASSTVQGWWKAWRACASNIEAMERENEALRSTNKKLFEQRDAAQFALIGEQEDARELRAELAQAKEAAKAAEVDAGRMLTDAELDGIGDAHRWDTTAGRRLLMRAAIDADRSPAMAERPIIFSGAMVRAIGESHAS